MAKKNWKLIGLVLLISLIVCPMTYADKDKTGEVQKIEKQMWEAAKKLDFERAAALRDKLKKLKMSSTSKHIEKEENCGYRLFCGSYCREKRRPAT